MRLTLLHTNDVHGRVDGLARVATLVERIRAETPHRVLYVDCGDVEESTVRLSNLTKGVAMHRLLAEAGCEAAAVGNGACLRYGPQVLADHARTAPYPLLLGNLEPVEGAVATALLDGVGLVGVTDPFLHVAPTFGLRALDAVEVVRAAARELRARGAELVVCLSHLGLERFDDRPVPTIDRELAAAVQGEVDVVLGAHSHHLLPEGERIGSVLVAQAGMYAQHLGRVDVDGGEIRASVIPVGEDVPPHAAVLASAAEAERELEESLAEVIAHLDAPLDPAWIAEALRVRMDADVGVVVEGHVLDAVLPAGPLRRGDLWAACHSTGNPSVCVLTGAQLRRVLEVGTDPEFRRRTPRVLRGRACGRLAVAGLDGGVDEGRSYRVAATDFELEPYGGLVDPAWRLEIRYEVPTILREAIEEHLARL